MRAIWHDHLIMDNLFDQNIHQNLISTAWIEALALEEINMDESGMVNFNEHLDPKILLDESSVEFMNKLRDLFEVFVEKFNEYRGGPHAQAQIKIFKISNTVNDFMLFRNSTRLIVSRKSFDRISIGFLAPNGNILTPRMAGEMSSQSSPSHEIQAHVGPFNDISWRYSGEIVEVQPLVRYYLSEFVRNSAR